MARKEQTEEVRIYSYDSTGPIQGAECLTEQAYLGHRFYNKLVEIERERRAIFTEARRRHCPGLDEAETDIEAMDAKIEAIREQIGKGKASKRTRAVDPVLALELKNLRAMKKPLYARLVALKAEFKQMTDPANLEFKRRKEAIVGDRKLDTGFVAATNIEVREQMLTEPEWHEAWKMIARGDAAAVTAAKKARAENGLLGGATSDLIVDAFTRAKLASKAPPTFHPWKGRGRVGVSVCAPVCQVMGGSLQLSIAPLPLSTWASRSGRRHSDTTVTLRLGKGAPPVVVPIKLDRPLPEGGSVRDAWISTDRVGTRNVFRVQITVAGGVAWKNPNRKPVTTPREQAVAVNFGWSKQPGGLRVAYWRGTDGRSGEILIPGGPPKAPKLRPDGRVRFQKHSLLARLDFPDALRAIQDTHFNVAAKALIEARRELTLPEWIGRDGKDQLQFAHAWKASAKLAGYVRHLARAVGEERIRALWAAWRVELLAQKEDLLAAPSAISEWSERQGVASQLERFAFRMWVWLEKDQHLYTWASHERDNALRARREIFRVAARKLEQEYDRLVVEEFDMAKVAKRAAVDEETDMEKAQRFQRKTAAPGDLRAALVLAFGGPKSGRIIKAEAAGNSATHETCGEALVGDDKTRHKCERCSVVVESDDNNCRNQLRKSGFTGEGVPQAAE